MNVEIISREPSPVQVMIVKKKVQKCGMIKLFGWHDDKWCEV